MTARPRLVRLLGTVLRAARGRHGRLLLGPVLGLLASAAVATPIVSDESGYLEIWAWESRHGEVAGYIEFDRSSFDAYDEWLGLQDACWDETGEPCPDLPDYFQFELEIRRAAVRVKGRMFNANDITWINTDRCYPYCDARVEVSFLDESGDALGLYCYKVRGTWLRDNCSDYYLQYSIRGQQGASNVPPYFFLSWEEIAGPPPWPSPEPGTLPLIALGLIVVGVTRRDVRITLVRVKENGLGLITRMNTRPLAHS